MNSNHVANEIWRRLGRKRRRLAVRLTWRPETQCARAIGPFVQIDCFSNCLPIVVVGGFARRNVCVDLVNWQLFADRFVRLVDHFVCRKPKKNYSPTKTRRRRRSRFD